MKFFVAFALLVLLTLVSAPRAEQTPPPVFGGNSAPAPTGTDNGFTIGPESSGDDIVCINGVCAPRSSFRFASSGGCSSASASGCSSSAAANYGAGGCSGTYGAARWPMARAFGAGLYRLSHPFAAMRARRAAAFGCGG